MQAASCGSLGAKLLCCVHSIVCNANEASCCVQSAVFSIHVQRLGLGQIEQQLRNLLHLLSSCEVEDHHSCGCCQPGMHGPSEYCRSIRAGLLRTAGALLGHIIVIN